MLDSFYTKRLADHFSSFNQTISDIVIKHSLVPLKSSDVRDLDGTSVVRIVDEISLDNTLTKEFGTLMVDILDVPVKTLSGYKIRGVNRQVSDLYEMSRGWHFEELKEYDNSQDEFSNRIVKFIPDTSSTQMGYHYIFGLKKGIISLMRGRKSVPVSIFLKALTGDSFATSLVKIGVSGKHVVNTFSVREPSRTECVDICNELFVNKDKEGKQRKSDPDMRVKLTEFVNKFVGYNAMIGNGAGRMADLFSFRINLKNCFLAKDIILGNEMWPEGTKLLPEILLELDYSEIDELHVRYQDNPKIFIFKKYDVFNFRGLHKGSNVTLSQLRELDSSSLTSYVLDNGVELKRSSSPLCNTTEIIYNILNMYVNFLGGFSLNSNVYSLDNQSLVSIDNKILSICAERLSYINMKTEELLDASTLPYTIKNLSSKLIPFDVMTLVDTIAKTMDKSVQLSSSKNSLAMISRDQNVVKNMKRQQGDTASIQPSQIGRLDPFDVPENENVGLTHNRTFMSKIGSNSQLTAPYVRVENGKAVSDVVYLSVSDERDCYIGEWNETFEGESTKARYNGILMHVHPSKLNYIEASPYQHMSVARSLSPFPENMAGKRSQMASSHGKQGIPLFNAERPIVNSGAESLVCGINDTTKSFFTTEDLVAEFQESRTEAPIIPENEKNDVILRFTGFQDDETDRIFIFELQYKSDIYEIKKKLPAFQPTLVKTVYGFQINKYQGLEFKWDDIVLHSLTFDPRKYERDDRINTGSVGTDDSVFDSGLALGVNLRVGYMTHGSSTIDDPIVINSRLVSEDILSSFYIYQEEYELRRTDGKKKEYFGFARNNKIPSGFTVDGIPIVGTYLTPGSTILYKFMMELPKLDAQGNVIDSDQGLSVNPTNVELPPTVGGEVVSSSIRGKIATVTIISTQKIEDGDKLSGRYGNKGVVGKIVPNNQMYYDPETGETLDICLNPLGIPSRTNISQVLEVSLAACCKKENKITIQTPFQTNNIEYIREKCEQQGVKPVRLVNGLNGVMTEGEVHVGYIYMYKLEHRASEKIHSIGVTNEIDPTFQQPTGSGRSKAKGQAFGEMEHWCLDSACAKILEHEIQTVLSTDRESLEKMEKYIMDKPYDIDVNPSTFVNNNDSHLNMFHLCSGYRLEQDANDTSYFTVVPLTDDFTIALNPNKKININDPVNSLRSVSIFSSHFSSEDRWSWMPLGGEMIHPFWILRGKINNFVVLGKYLNPAKLSVLRPVDVKNIMIGEAGVVKVNDIWCLVDGESDIERSGAETGMSGLVKLFKEFDLSVSENYYKNTVEGREGTVNLRGHQMLDSLHEIQMRGNLSQYVISCIPVMPIRFRPESIVPNKQQDFDYFYTLIANSVLNYTQSGSNKDMYKTYCYIASMLGIIDKADNPLGDKKIVDLKTFMTNKKAGGRIRGCIGKKRLLRSGRAPLIPFQDTSLSPEYIGIPYLIAINLWEWELSSLLMKKMPNAFSEDNRRGNMVLAKKILKAAVLGDETFLYNITASSSGKNCVVIKRMIQDFAENRIVVFGRQPSLHKLSVRAFRPKLVEGKAIQIHPLVCKGYNADFDGDTGYIIAPFTVAAEQDAWDKLSVQNGIINPGTGNVILEPTQDILLGCYFATIFKDNALEPGKISPLSYSGIGVMLSDLDIGLIKPYTWVSVQVSNRLYLSTAGRIAFNSLIPGAFTSFPYVDKYKLGISPGVFCQLKYDSVVSGRVADRDKYVSINAIFRSLYDEFSTVDRAKIIDIYQSIAQFGFIWSERSGISFRLEDLKESEIVKDFLESAAAVSDEIDRQFQMGLMSESGRKEAMMAVYASVKTQEFQKEFANSMDRTNNLFMMFDSKARGSVDQIMQTCGLIGILQKTKTDSLDIPITANYTTGLSSFDLFETSYSTRLGLLSTIMETSKPGELTRTLTYEFSGLHVSSQSCWTNDSPPLQIDYKLNSEFVFFRGRPVKDESELYGLHLDDEEAMKYAKYLSPGGILNAELLESLRNSGLPWFDTEQGRVHFDTEFPEIWANLLFKRTAKRKYDGLINGKYISSETIESFIESKPRFIHAMLLQNCVEKDGICADSYGLKIDRFETVEIGDFPGEEAAQAIAEPTSQLTMSLFHTGGKAGASVDDDITIVSSAIQNANIKIWSVCKCAPINGYVRLEESTIRIVGDERVCEVSFSGRSGDLLVVDGEYVRIGKYLTKGDIHPIMSFGSPTISVEEFEAGSSGLRVTDTKRLGVINPSLELVTQMRFELTKFYYNTYHAKGIDVLARHFEVPAYMQTAFGVVVTNRHKNFKAGRTYRIGEIFSAGKGAVDFKLLFSTDSDIILNGSGVIAALCYRDAYNVVGKAGLRALPLRERSTVSAIMTGSDLTLKGLPIKDINNVDYQNLKVARAVDTGVVKPVSSYKDLDIFSEESDQIDDVPIDDSVINDLLSQLGIENVGSEETAEKEIANEDDSLLDDFFGSGDTSLGSKRDSHSVGSMDVF